MYEIPRVGYSRSLSWWYIKALKLEARPSLSNPENLANENGGERWELGSNTYKQTAVYSQTAGRGQTKCDVTSLQ